MAKTPSSGSSSSKPKSSKSRASKSVSSSALPAIDPASIRPIPTNRPSFVASAARVRLREKPKPTRTADWQAECWDAYDAIGEVKYAMNFVANVLAKVRLFPAMVPDDPREAPKPDSNPLGLAAIRDFKGPSGDYAEILRESAVNLFVPGEYWLLGIGEGSDGEISTAEVNSWEVRSIDEFSLTNDGVGKLRDVPSGPQRDITDENAVIIRRWLRHPRYSQLPDSPLRGVLSSCLAEGSLVYTPAGPVPIEQVESGQEVWSRSPEGDLIAATVKSAIPKGRQQVYRVRTASRTLLATSDHPVLVLRQIRPKAKTWEASWVSVGELRRKDYLVILAEGNEGEAEDVLPDGDAVFTEDAWVFGLFMGDGSFTENGVAFAVEGVNRERIVAWANERWNANCSVSGGTGQGQGPQTHVNSRALMRAWKSLGLHAAAPEKDIPGFVWGWSRKMQEAFIEGYQDADGHWTKQGWRSYATSSFKMARSLQALHILHGDKVSNLFCEQRKKPIRIPLGRYGDGGGGFMKRTLPLWRFQVYNRASFRYNTKVLQSHGARAVVGSENFSVEKIRSIHLEGEAQVWDLDIPGPRNFIAEGVVVHNCEEIKRIERAIRAAARSRAAGPGLLLVPDEASFGNLDPTTESSGSGEALNDPFMRSLIEGMMTPIQDEGSASAVVPLVLRAPADVLSEIRKISLAQDVDAELMKLDRALTRLAQGLPLPPEIITGKADLNHWCCSIDTECFTRDGWRTSDQIPVGTEVLTLNHITGATEWLPVLDKYEADVRDEPMIHLVGQKHRILHESLSTPNHRWPVLRDGKRVWVTSETLYGDDEIILGASSADIPTESKYSDAFVELVAWYMCDGTQIGTTPQVRIGKSHRENPHKVAELRRVFTELFGPAHPGPIPQRLRRDGIARWTEMVEDFRGMTLFCPNKVAAESLLQLVPSKEKIVPLWFVHQLTRAQLHLFIDTVMMADGDNPAGTMIGQADPRRLDAIELAAVLLGHGTKRWIRRSGGFEQFDYHMLSIRKTTSVKVEARPTTYTGTIWCPVTKNKSWLARSNGHSYFTGNTAFQVSEETFAAHIEPLLVVILGGITTEYYRDYLIVGGMSEEEAARRMLWYDATDVISRPNQAADADFGLDHMALSDAAWRRIKGFTEDDAPSTIEQLRRLILQRGSFDPILTNILLQSLGIDVPYPPSAREVIELPGTPQPDAPAPTREIAPPAPERPRSISMPRSFIVASASSPDSYDIGSRLLDIDRDLETRLHSVADAAVRRSLERACSTVVSRLRHNKHFMSIIEDTPKLEVAARLTSITLATEGMTADKLLKGSFDHLAPRFIDWASRAYTRAFRALGISPPAEADTTTFVAEAADWLVMSLTQLAAVRLFDPTPPTELFGELDDTYVVPYSIIREAITRAGGCVNPRLYDSAVSGSYETDRPLGGIATGSVVCTALVSSGGSIEGWEWDYGEGVRTREYEPHQSLHGIRFTRHNDDLLVNRATWPPVAFLYPGDHACCACKWRPIISLPVTVEETA